MELRSLLPHELETWFDFLANSCGLPNDHQIRHWEADPQRAVTGIRVAVEEEQIRASLRIFHREIYLGGNPIPMGGVGEVCTHPAYRGRGLSGRLLEDAIDQMARAGKVVSVLFTGLPDHYARYGWQSVPIEMALSRLSPAADDQLVIAPANLRDPGEVRQVQALYEPMARSRQGTMVRTDLDYWTGWVAGESQRAVVARQGHRLVGYLATRWTESGDLYIQDFAAQPGEESALVIALTSALARERSLQEVKVRYPLALGLSLPLDGVEREVGPMYRVIRPQELPLASAQALEHLLQGRIDDHLIWATDLY